MDIFKQCAQKRTSMNLADLVSLKPKGLSAWDVHKEFGGT